MNKIKIGFLVGVFFVFSSVAFGLNNPSQVYCSAMNYSFVITEIPEGEVGYCYFNDGVSCDAWDFLMGVCGTEYNYCSLSGYDSETITDMGICNSENPEEQCCACILNNGTAIEVTELMGLNFAEGKCGDLVCAIGETYENCPSDCPSGGLDLFCDGLQDGRCDPDCKNGEDVDCLPVCGNELCEQNETYENCPVDCGKESVCGNGVCERDETIITCNLDCKKKSTCGNGVCGEKESYQICPEDCKSGYKDFFCDSVDDGRCDPDCKNGEDVDCQIERSSHWWIYSLSILAILFSLILLIRKVRVSKNA